MISRKLEIGYDSCNVACKDLRSEFDDCVNDKKDPSFYWLKLKTAIKGIAKERERELKVLEREKYSILLGFYSSILIDIQRGGNCYDELDKVRKDMDDYYRKVSKDKIDKMRSKDIDDHVYDIHKLQNQKKYENL